tara:strand:- start:12201 stop:15371 length:3171 start_codon:yes stop_codon:yes gene_type:complete
MSINTIADRKHEAEISALLTILNKFISRWKAANTIEDKIIIESQAVKYFEKLLNNELGLPEVSALSHPNSDQFGEARTSAKYKTDMCVTRLTKLSEMYIRNFNTKVKILMELTGSLKRVRQKKAALDLWDREKAKWVIAEKFLNLDNINSTYSGATILNADVSQGILTLPVETTTQVRPRNIRITSGNGYIGNSDTDVTTNNIKPEYMFDGNPETWFEYERLDSGPAEMSLTLDFSSAEIVNMLTIRAVNLGAGLNYQIDDIIFATSGSKTVSIKELVGNTIKPDDFVIKTIGNDIFWQMSFLPVTCTNVTIKFKQENYYRAEMQSVDSRPITRKRYPIGVKSIIISRQKFKGNGGISSSYYSLPAGLYAAESSSSIFPRKNKLYDAFLDFSADNGESWNLDVFGFEDTTTPNTISLDGVPGTGLWRLYVERNDSAFKNTSSYTDEDVSTLIKVFSRTVSPAISPALITLRDKPYNKAVGVFQPRVCRRTDDPREAVRIGRAPSGQVPGEGFVLPLPIELDSEGYELDPNDMTVYENRVEIPYGEISGATISFEELKIGSGTEDRAWMINDNWTQIALQVHKQHGEISWKFPSQQLEFEQRSDGFYAAFSDSFDPDKKRIRLTGLSSSEKQTSEILNSSSTIFNLKRKNIIGNSEQFIVTREEGSGYPVFKRTYLKQVRLGGSPSGEVWYYIDYVNGKLYIDKPLSTADSVPSIPLVKIQYKSYDTTVHKDEDYKIWAEDLDLKGIIIDPDKIVAEDIEFEVKKPGDYTPKLILDLKSGETTFKTPIFHLKDFALDLPYDYIVKGSVRVGPDFLGNEPEAPAPYETQYIDGKTEFLGLIHMENEATVEMTSTGDTGLVRFKLAAGSAWYKGLGVSFADEEVFANLIGDDDGAMTFSFGIGDYTIGPDGLVCVRVADPLSVGTLKGGISYTYSYADPSFDSENLISIDYKRGIIFASRQIVKGEWSLDGDKTSPALPAPIVKFKVARYKAEYDIIKAVDSFKYSAGSNSVSINTENIRNRINKRVKVYYAVPDDFVPLKDMEEYFSPIIYNVSFRFQ